MTKLPRTSSSSDCIAEHTVAADFVFWNCCLNEADLDVNLPAMETIPVLTTRGELSEQICISPVQ
jgi:hypothetical protein